MEDFAEFLAAQVGKKDAALDRLPAIAPALEAAGAPSLTGKISAEVKASRAERRVRQAAPGAGKHSDTHRF